MDKFFRVILTLFFLIVSVGRMIESRAVSNSVPLTGAKAQGRSAISVSTAHPRVMDPGIQEDQHPLVDQSIYDDKKYFPCQSLSITTSGAVCDDYELEFPEVTLSDVLDGDSYLPHKSATVLILEKIIHAIVYRNIALELRWDPATPSFLQIHLAEYLPYWENRIPYRLFWNAQYEICYELCYAFSEKGEFLPEDIEGLPPSLAADINFNGVPVAFWNENVNP